MTTKADPGVRIVTSEDAVGLLTQEECNAALRVAFQELGHGVAYSLPRNRLYIPTDDPSTYHTHNSFTGAVPAYNTVALRVDEVNVRFIERPGGLRGMDHPGDYTGLVLLFRIDSRELYGIIHDHALSTMRVAGTSAIVSERMARPNATSIGLIGAGQQALSMLVAHVAEIPSLRSARFYIPSAEKREEATARLSQASGLAVEAVDNPRAAITGADIVASATSSFDPTFKGEWLETGQHVTSIVNSDYFIRKTEIDMEVMRRASVVIVNSKDYARADNQPEIAHSIREKWLDWDDIVEVSDLMCRRLHGRTSSEAITVHFNNGGMGIQFAAAGALLLKHAEEKGVGTVLPSELFVSRRSPDILSGP